MISNALVRKAVQVEYSLLRAPLAVVNRGLASRLGSGSTVRSTFERGLGSLDALAGQLLAEPSSDRSARSPRPSRRDSAPRPEHDEAVERVAEELLEQQEQKPVVGELADSDLQELQAELRAKHLVEEHEDEKRVKREHEQRVRAAKKAPRARKSAASSS